MREDAEQIFSVVNAAYEKEKGNTGIAFKVGDRLATVECVHMEREPHQYLVVTWRGKEKEGQREHVVACAGIDQKIAADSTEGERMALNFGPFAVRPDLQCQGIGSTLLEAIDACARFSRASWLEIEVVNHRSDLLPWYEKRGFVTYGQAPLDEEHNCGESNITRPSHFILLRRRVAKKSSEE